MAAFQGYGATLFINRGSAARPAWEELGKVRSLQVGSFNPAVLNRLGPVTIEPAPPNSTPPPGRIPEALIGATLAGLMLLLSLFIAMLSG